MSKTVRVCLGSVFSLKMIRVILSHRAMTDLDCLYQETVLLTAVKYGIVMPQAPVFGSVKYGNVGALSALLSWGALHAGLLNITRP